MVKKVFSFTLGLGMLAAIPFVLFIKGADGEIRFLEKPLYPDHVLGEHQDELEDMMYWLANRATAKFKKLIPEKMGWGWYYLEERIGQGEITDTPDGNAALWISLYRDESDIVVAGQVNRLFACYLDTWTRAWWNDCRQRVLGEDEQISVSWAGTEPVDIFPYLGKDRIPTIQWGDDRGLLASVGLYFSLAYLVEQKQLLLEETFELNVQRHAQKTFEDRPDLDPPSLLDDTRLYLDRFRQDIPMDMDWAAELQIFRQHPEQWYVVFAPYHAERFVDEKAQRVGLATAFFVFALFFLWQTRRISVAMLMRQAFQQHDIEQISGALWRFALNHWWYLVYQPADAKVREQVTAFVEHAVRAQAESQLRLRIQQDWDTLQQRSLSTDMQRTLEGTYVVAMDTAKSLGVRTQAAETLANHVRRTVVTEVSPLPRVTKKKSPRQTGESPRQMQIVEIMRLASFDPERLEKLTLKELGLLHRGLALLVDVAPELVTPFIESDVKQLLRKPMLARAIEEHNVAELATLLHVSYEGGSATPAPEPAFEIMESLGDKLRGKRVLIIGKDAAAARYERYITWINNLGPASVRFVNAKQIRQLQSSLANGSVDLAVILLGADNKVKDILQRSNIPAVLIKHVSESRFLTELLEGLDERVAMS